jgi:hypothetical protein
MRLSHPSFLSRWVSFVYGNWPIFAKDYPSLKLGIMRLLARSRDSQVAFYA